MSDVAVADAPAGAPGATAPAPATTITPAAPGAPAAPATAAAPWYQGKADAETIGYWQNKAWKHDDPVTIALEATKAAREAQKFVGAPPDQLLRLPKDAKDETGWNNVWTRLGKPSDPKDYDLSDAKFADGSAIDETMAAMIRKTAFENNLPKDAAAAFARALAKQADEAESSTALEAKTKWDEGIARIRQNWGNNFNANQLQAQEGLRRLGIAQEHYDAMAKSVGVDIVAEMFRKIGAGTAEHTFVDGANGAVVATVEGARARRSELMQDKDFIKKYKSGDTAAVREMRGLNRLITGVTEAA